MMSSKDCSQLADLNADPASYRVMADGSWLTPGLLLRGTWLRAGVLNTKARRSRGGRLEDVDKLSVRVAVARWNVLTTFCRHVLLRMM